MQPAAYSAAKAGVLALTRVAAAEYGRHGIRVNAILHPFDPRDMLDTRRMLTDDECMLVDVVRRFVTAKVLPEADRWFERGEFPARELASELGQLGLLGMHLDGYGCAASSATAYGLASSKRCGTRGKAALVVIAVESSAFIARYTIFVPGAGGWGGDRGRSTPREAPPEPGWHDTFHVPDNLAALYRLTGDEHPVHIDPVVAESMGFSKPILHGPCTLAITARATAAAVGKSPVEFRTLDLRFAQPVLSGDDLFLSTSTQDGRVTATVATDADAATVLTLRYGDGT